VLLILHVYKRLHYNSPEVGAELFVYWAVPAFNAGHHDE
jgi:hypothetical protein